jgi:hypothetical protein
MMWLSNLCVLAAACCLQERKAALQHRAAAAAEAEANSAGPSTEQCEADAVMMKIFKVLGIFNRWDEEKQREAARKAADAALAPLTPAQRVQLFKVRNAHEL